MSAVGDHLLKNLTAGSSMYIHRVRRSYTAPGSQSVRSAYLGSQSMIRGCPLPLQLKLSPQQLTLYCI